MTQAVQAVQRFVSPSVVDYSQPTVWLPGWTTYWGLDQMTSSQVRNAYTVFHVAFTEPPWNENWPWKLFHQKLVREMTVPKIPECENDRVFITLIDGDSESPLSGFCCGAVVDVSSVEGRVVSAHHFTTGEYEQLQDALAAIPGDRVIFDDEICVPRRFRAKEFGPGILRLAQLCYPSTYVGAAQGLGAITWSHQKSRMTPILLAYGFHAIGQVGEMTLMYSPPDETAKTKGSLEELINNLVTT